MFDASTPPATVVRYVVDSLDPEGTSFEGRFFSLSWDHQGSYKPGFSFQHYATWGTTGGEPTAFFNDTDIPEAVKAPVIQWAGAILNSAGLPLKSLNICGSFDKLSAATPVPLGEEALTEITGILRAGAEVNPGMDRLLLEFYDDRFPRRLLVGPVGDSPRNWVAPGLQRWRRLNARWYDGIGALHLEGFMAGREHARPPVRVRREPKGKPRRTCKDRRLDGGVERLYGTSLVPLRVEALSLELPGNVWLMRRGEAAELISGVKRSWSLLRPDDNDITISHWKHTSHVSGMPVYEKQREVTINPYFVDEIDLMNGDEGTPWSGRTLDDVLGNKELDRLEHSDWTFGRGSGNHFLYDEQDNRIIARIWARRDGCHGLVFPLDRPHLRFRYLHDKVEEARQDCVSALVRIGYGEWIDADPLSKHLEILPERAAS